MVWSAYTKRDEGCYMQNAEGFLTLHSSIIILYLAASRPLNVQELNVEGVVFDELTAGRDFVAHQQREKRVGLCRVVDGHAEQAALLRIHRGFEQLLGVHFTETLVALYRETLASERANVAEHFQRRVEIGLALAFLANVFTDAEAWLI